MPSLKITFPGTVLYYSNLTRPCWISNSVILAEVWTRSPFALASNLA